MTLDLTQHWAGVGSLVLFGLAYLAVMGEEALQMRKSKPVMLAAGLIWLLIGAAYAMRGDLTTAAEAARHTLAEYAELFLFLLASMTFTNTLEDRGVFEALRGWLVGRGFSLRSLFWITGALAFAISSVANNLTTAMVMGAVAMAVGAGSPRFVLLACINVVVAVNAGGAFCPFGDITTLMVWQSGNLGFGDFFALLVPALVNWLVPAACMSFALEPGRPEPIAVPRAMQPGAMGVLVLFGLTLALSALVHSLLGLPPVLGMMTGLAGLKLFGYYQARRYRGRENGLDEPSDVFAEPVSGARSRPFDSFKQMERVEWDTLMFFYGVMISVGGLGTLGYLALASQGLYGHLGASVANVLVGGLSAVVDNIPVMFAVLSMHPAMSHGQWLLVTFTTGVGGSLLSIGSAAGVALMGQARGVYTFVGHLKWIWAIALGYVLSVAVHFWINAGLFRVP